MHRMEASVDWEKAGLLMNGKIKAQTQEERILVEAHRLAIEGRTLLKAFFQVSEFTENIDDKFLAFVMGFSMGTTTRKFSYEERKDIPQNKLN